MVMNLMSKLNEQTNEGNSNELIKLIEKFNEWTSYQNIR